MSHRDFLSDRHRLLLDALAKRGVNIHDPNIQVQIEAELESYAQGPIHEADETGQMIIDLRSKGLLIPDNGYEERRGLLQGKRFLTSNPARSGELWKLFKQTKSKEGD